MLVVLPVCAKDIDLATRNLDWCLRLEERADFDALIAAEQGTSLNGLTEKAARYFRRADLYTYDRWTGPSTWPQPQNWAWQTVARHVPAITKAPWFWWEADVTPLRRGWLATLAKEYYESGKPFMGHIVPTMGHMNGVAVYPNRVMEHTQDALIVRAAAWDRMLWRDIREKTHCANHLMAHYPRFTGVQLSFNDPAAVTKLLDSGFVIFHGCNDGSLIDLLLGQAPKPGILRRIVRLFTANDVNTTPDEAESGWQYEAAHLQTHGYGVIPYQECTKPLPSFTRQTPWPSGIFPLPLDGRVCHFNPGLVKAQNKLWLVTRRWDHRGTFWQSSLSAWQLDDDLYPVHETRLAFPFARGAENFEDPRVIWHDGRFWVSYCVWRYNRLFRSHQSFSAFSPTWQHLSVTNVPYGNNGYTIGSGGGHEKNWIWFRRPGDHCWHFVYSFNPHVVIRVDTPTQLRKFETSLPRPLPWLYGEVRGGTPPALVGDEFISFFHSSLFWRGRQKRFYAGAYAFDAKPPFAVRRMTLKPLFAGSEADTRILGGPLVVFPNGAVFTDNEWLLSFGVNDEACGWMRIPHRDLDGLLVPVGDATPVAATPAIPQST